MFKFAYKDIDFAHKLDEASKPTEEYYKHIHLFNELLYFIKGDVVYTVEGEEHTLTEGDIVLIPSSNYHFATVNSDVSYERFVLKFPNDILPDYLIERINTQGYFLGNSKKYAHTFDQLDNYYGNYDDDELCALFQCELIRLLVLLCHEPARSTEQSHGVIAALVNYIDANLQAPLTVDMIAEQFSFSKSYISNEFRKHMKIPLMQYVRAKKIFAAHEMILGGEKKHVVAELFGFDDYSTFYRSYVKVMGFPPNAVRKKK